MSNTRNVLPLAVPALFLFLLIQAVPAQAQVGSQGPAGHWDGHVELPSGPLEVHLDLRRVNGKWTGEIVIPTESTRSMPVDAIEVSGRRVSFDVGMRGGPRFNGKLDRKGTHMDGRFKDADDDYPFRLVRAGGGGRVPGPGD